MIINIPSTITTNIPSSRSTTLSTIIPISIKLTTIPNTKHINETIPIIIYTTIPKTITTKSSYIITTTILNSIPTTKSTIKPTTILTTVYSIIKENYLNHTNIPITKTITTYNIFPTNISSKILTTLPENISTGILTTTNSKEMLTIITIIHTIIQKNNIDRNSCYYIYNNSYNIPNKNSTVINIIIYISPVLSINTPTALHNSLLTDLPTSISIIYQLLI